MQLPYEVQAISGLSLVAVENQGQHKGKQEDRINYVAQQGLFVPIPLTVVVGGGIRNGRKKGATRNGDNDEVIPVH